MPMKNALLENHLNVVRALLFTTKIWEEAGIGRACDREERGATSRTTPHSTRGRCWLRGHKNSSESFGHLHTYWSPSDIATLTNAHMQQVTHLAYRHLAGLHTGGDGLHTGRDGLHTGSDGLHTFGDELHTGGDGLPTGGVSCSQVIGCTRVVMDCTQMVIDAI